MIDQMTLVLGIIKLLGEHGVASANSRQFNSVIAAANLIMRELEKPTMHSTPAMGLKAWLETDDTGLSSLAMARILCPGHTIMRSLSEVQEGIVPYPHDPDDFGRCYRFLRAVLLSEEDGRSRDIRAMSSISPVWASLTAAWDELEQLWEEESPTGKCPRLYARMQEIIKAKEQK